MKILQTAQENLSYLGISWYYSIQQYPINVRNVTAFLTLGSSAAMDCVYLCWVATTFQEYTDSVFTFSSIFSGTTIFACVIWRMRLVLDCINQIEKIANESEIAAPIDRMGVIEYFCLFPGLECAASEVLYDEINSKGEKWSKTIITVIMAVVPQGLLFPKFLLSYYFYYTTEMDSDAFQMPFPSWYVFKLLHSQHISLND